MSYRKIITLIVLAILALSLEGCGVKRLKDLKVTSWSLESVSLRGLRGLYAEMSLGIENPGAKITLDDISGTIFYKGEEFLRYTMEPLTLKARCTEVYSCHCTMDFEKSKSILDILAAINGFSLEYVTTDLDAKVKMNGIFSRKVSFKNIPVHVLLNRFKKTEKHETI